MSNEQYWEFSDQVPRDATMWKRTKAIVEMSLRIIYLISITVLLTLGSEMMDDNQALSFCYFTDGLLVWSDEGLEIRNSYRGEIKRKISWSEH